MRTSARNTFLFVLILFAVLPAAAQYYNIDFSAFPQDGAFRTQVADFFAIYKLVNHWTPEWKYDVPKDQAIQIMNTLLKSTNERIALAKDGNRELELFRGLLRNCLYNLDAGDQFQTNIAELEALEKKYPEDYRAPWLLGNFLVYSGNCFDGIRQYEYLFKNATLGKANADVVLDYCSTAFMAMMPATSVNIVESLAADNRVSNPNDLFSLYDAARDMLKEPTAGQALTAEEVFSYLERERGQGFLCRLFGAWLPVKDEWKVRPLDVYANGSGGMAITVPLKSARGRNINVSVLVLFQAQPRQSFEDFVKGNLKKFKDIVPYAPGQTAWPLSAFEMRDPRLYKENGGAHGFVAMLKRPQPKVKGVGIEAPSRIPRGNRTGAHYFQDKGGYTRYDGDIYYYFLLDSCEAVFEESKQVFFGLLDGMLLD